MMPDRFQKTLGESGESMAAVFLKKRGCRILERNFRLKIGEIDIIAREGNTICFIEVKTRRTVAYGAPAESVGRSKRRKLSRMALAYLQSRKLGDTGARFDVVAITLSPGGQPCIEWLKDAFEFTA